METETNGRNMSVSQSWIDVWYCPQCGKVNVSTASAPCGRCGSSKLNRFTQEKILKQPELIRETAQLERDTKPQERAKQQDLRLPQETREWEQHANTTRRVPQRVRQEVWRRDRGRCASCGSRERLEYDHIIPVSRGGSNTARNVELLCERCTRAKHNHIL